MKKKHPHRILEKLGAYGFGKSEIAVLAALVTEDPLLLIGNSGTGKTHLLNTLSEALGLEHRHYNASLVSFDDLVGFPFPEEGQGTVRFLETPATVWPAESVLVDEISRCKPEHQNRLFSLVHERRIQGIALPKLRYRWAAMNPCTVADGVNDYLGSEPLDKALADRFGLVVSVVDWDELTQEEQLQVADPSGEGALTHLNPGLIAQLAGWRQEFLAAIRECPSQVVEYARVATSALNLAGVRISPRRARMLSRSLLAAQIVAGERAERVYQFILSCSLPHDAWGECVPDATVRAAHRTTWDATMLEGPDQWIYNFHLEARASRKLRFLLKTCPDAETGSVAVSQFLANGNPLAAGTFAFASYPAALAGKLKLTAEAVADLARVATPILSVDATLTWQEPPHQSGTVHPGFAVVAPFLETLQEAPKERATQLFYWALGKGLDVTHPSATQKELEACMREMKVVAG